MKISIICCLMLVGSTVHSAHACSELPFWKNTLRCKFFPHANQTPPPLAKLQYAADIKDFTLVPLPSRNSSGEPLRCVDGTRPAIYVDEAESMDKSNWVVTFQGGGSCDDADSCLAAYLNPSERSEMGTATNRASKNMEGIHRTGTSNAFSRFNRIRIEKCSYDRYNGTTTQRNVSASIDSDVDQDGIQSELINDSMAVTDVSTQPTILEGERITVDLFHHGSKIVLHALDQLRTGLSYSTWEDDGKGGVNSIRKTLPALADAESVLFVGHSGAAHGLMNGIDHLAETLSTWTRISDGEAFNASVRAVFDAQLLPSIESEAAFNDHLPGDVFAHRTLCRAPCESGAPLHYTYDGMRYFDSGGAGIGGFYDGPSAEWDVPLDQTCLDAHPLDGWRCADRFHVLFNHISTAFFIREDFRDPNGQHNNNPAGPDNHGHRLFWADGRTEFCENTNDKTPCPPTLSAADFRARVEEQAERFVGGFDTRSELAVSGEPIPTVYLWLPDCGAHEGAFDDVQFNGVLLDSQSLGQQTSMHDFVVDFVQDATTGIINRQIDGEGDLRSLCQL